MGLACWVLYGPVYLLQVSKNDDDKRCLFKTIWLYNNTKVSVKGHHFQILICRYASIFDAVNKTDGLAVLGLFWDVETNNVESTKAHTSKSEVYQGGILTFILNQLRGNQERSYPYLNLKNELPLRKNSSGVSEYYRYKGSLTTPPCHESVTWTLFKQPFYM